MTIDASGVGVAYIVRSNAVGTPDFRIFRVEGGVSATLRGLIVLNGRIAGSGGASTTAAR